jgi:hypothetical protein
VKQTLIIMGSHPGTRGEFDWTREDGDIVVFNEAMHMSWVLRADYVLQMHLPIIWRNPTNRNDPGHYAWLKSGNTPVILMQEAYEDVPKATRYPIEDVKKLGEYLTSSAAYAIAWGIVSGYERIEIYGVEMETQTEYAHQRPGVAYWIGVAIGAGVTVDYHGGILTSPLYGYEGDVVFKYSYFEERIAELMVEGQAAIDAYNGSRMDAAKVIEDFVRTGDKPDTVIHAVQRQVELASKFGIPDGARQEILRYRGKADAQIKAGGDFIFGRQEFEHAHTSFIKQRDATMVVATKLASDCQAQFVHVKTTNNPHKRLTRMQDLGKTIQAFVAESIKVGMFDGAQKENYRFMTTLDQLMRMAGGEKSVEVLMAAHRETV